MKNYKLYSFISIILMIASTFVCCGNGDDDVVGSDKRLIGTWICYEQEITEAGETWKYFYDNEKNTLILNDDYTGDLHAYDNSLFEISGAHFIWQLSGNKLITTIGGSHTYIIMSLTNTEMTLSWTDEDLHIVCKFRKE